MSVNTSTGITSSTLHVVNISKDGSAPASSSSFPLTDLPVLTSDPLRLPISPPMPQIELENDSAGILVRPLYTYSRPPFLHPKTPWVAPRMVVVSSSAKFTATPDVIGPSAARGIAKIEPAIPQNYTNQMQKRKRRSNDGYSSTEFPYSNFVAGGNPRKGNSLQKGRGGRGGGGRGPYRHKNSKRTKKEKKAPRLCIGVSEPGLVGQEVTLGHSYNIKRKFLGKRAIVLGASPISGGWFEIAVLVNGKAIAQHRWRRKAIIPISDQKGSESRPSCSKETIATLLKQYRSTGKIELPLSSKRKMKDVMRIALANQKKLGVRGIKVGMGGAAGGGGLGSSFSYSFAESK